MTFIQRYRTSFTTASSAATVYLPDSTTGGVINGIVDTLLYYLSTAPPTTTANFTITVENTSQSIFNRTAAANEVSFEVCPVRQSHTVAGTTIAIATAGIEGVSVANSRLVVSITTGGDDKTGIIEVIVR